MAAATDPTPTPPVEAPAAKPVTLAPGELAWLINDAWRTIHQGQAMPTASIAEAVGTAMRESGGRTDARRDASKNPAGGNDLGLWQINDKANKMSAETAAMMFDAFGNAAKAATLMNGGVQLGIPTPTPITPDFSCWGGTHGTKPSCPNYNPTAGKVDPAAWMAAAKNPVDPTVKLAAAGHIRDAKERFDYYKIDHTVVNNNGLPDVLGWADSLGSLLSNLIDPSWWRRVGVFALGIVLVVIAVVLAIAPTVKDAVT